jgi:ATP-dependent DNA helicase RecG
MSFANAVALNSYHSQIKKLREVILNHGAISGVNRDELEAKEKIILSEIETNPNLSTRELSENLNIPFRSVQRYISNLRKKGFIERVGANKNGYWKVIK